MSQSGIRRSARFSSWPSGGRDGVERGANYETNASLAKVSSANRLRHGSHTPQHLRPPHRVRLCAVKRLHVVSWSDNQSNGCLFQAKGHSTKTQKTRRSMTEIVLFISPIHFSLCLCVIGWQYWWIFLPFTNFIVILVADALCLFFNKSQLRLTNCQVSL